MVSLLLFAGAVVWGGPNEQYVDIYVRMQQAEALGRTGRPAQELAMLLQIRKELTQFQKANPTWNAKVVNYRLKYIGQRIEQLSPKPAPAAAQKPPNAAQQTGVGTAQNSVLQGLQDQIAGLESKLSQSQTENTLLQAKLKEALAARPASVDPRRLTEVEERNRDLAKELDLLQAELAEAKAGDGDKVDVAALDQARAELKDVTELLNKERSRARQLESDNAALRGRVNNLVTSLSDLEALRAENALLKGQVAELQTAASADDSKARLAEATAQVALLTSDMEILELEKMALEARLAEQRNRIASKPPAASKANTDADEVAALKARLSAYEAEAQPYSVEEKALIRMSRSMLDVASLGSPTPKAPPGAATLVAEVETHIRKKEYQLAEIKLEKIVEMDDSNARILANLAATQIEQGKYDEAEKNLMAAIKVAPKDDFTLGTLGYLKFLQKDYEAALDWLSQAVQINPRNPVTQNYLGVALSERGLRGPAETALRRAIQLKSDFPQAHFNLAFVYATQDPPLNELARWHYQQSLDAGHQRSVELERLLDGPRNW